MAVDKAAALKYRAGDKAPFLVCKGKRLLADRLILEAEKNGIPLIKNEELLEEVLELSPMDYIPEEMYGVVAEILSFVYAHGNGKKNEND